KAMAREEETTPKETGGMIREDESKECNKELLNSKNMENS
ncbi:hypothetical protein A2U01_0072217, partial [Trifolium medium]|nr:hypothetical protein [Trifolium medium]